MEQDDGTLNTYEESSSQSCTRENNAVSVTRAHTFKQPYSEKISSEILRSNPKLEAGILSLLS
jgi:hypothetical protein